MEHTIQRLTDLLDQGERYLRSANPDDLAHRPSPGKWSKKEILGHLLDSAVNNLKRFTEIQFHDRPYRIVPYAQKELVEANQYQQADIKELSSFWLAINRRLIEMMKHQTETTLAHAIELPDGALSDLRFLMVDYVDHLEHHVQQIVV